MHESSRWRSLEHLADPIVVLNRAGEIQFANERFRKLAQVSTADQTYALRELVDVAPSCWDSLRDPHPILVQIQNVPFSFNGGLRGRAHLAIDPQPADASGETHFVCSFHEVSQDLTSRRLLEEKDRQIGELRFAHHEAQFLWRLALETPIYLEDSVFFSALGRKLREELEFADACFLLTPDADNLTPEPFPGEMRVGSILREAARAEVPELRRRPGRYEVWTFDHDLFGSFWMVSVRPKLGRPFFLIARPQPNDRTPDRRQFFESLAKQLSTWLDNRSMYVSSITDALTGLFNRRHFDSRFTVECLLARERRNVISVLLFDLDFFKKINDSFGHQIGDLVLRTTSAVLKNTLRATDFAARVGGEEFGILLFDTTPADAMIAAEKIRKQIADTPIELPNWNQSIRVTVSCGIANYHGAAGQTPETVYGAADEALYRAKTAGRNRVETSDVTTLGKSAA